MDGEKTCKQWGFWDEQIEQWYHISARHGLLRARCCGDIAALLERLTRVYGRSWTIRSIGEDGRPSGQLQDILPTPAESGWRRTLPAASAERPPLAQRQVVLEKPAAFHHKSNGRVFRSLGGGYGHSRGLYPSDRWRWKLYRKLGFHSKEVTILPPLECAQAVGSAQAGEKICKQCGQPDPLEKFYRDQEKKKPAKGDTICTSCWLANVEVVANRNDVDGLRLRWLIEMSVGFSRYSLFCDPRWRYLKRCFSNFWTNEEYHEGNIRGIAGKYYLPFDVSWSRLISGSLWCAIRTNGASTNEPTQLYRRLRAAVRVRTETRLLGRNQKEYGKRPQLEFIPDQEGGGQTSDDDLGTFGTYTSQVHAKCKPIGMRTRHPRELGKAGRETLPWAPYDDEETNRQYRKINDIKPLKGRTERKRNRHSEKRNIPLGVVEPLGPTPALEDPTAAPLEAEERQAELSLMLEEMGTWLQERGQEPARLELLQKNYGKDRELAEQHHFPSVNALHKWRHDWRKKLRKQFPQVWPWW